MAKTLGLLRRLFQKFCGTYHSEPNEKNPYCKQSKSSTSKIQNPKKVEARMSSEGTVIEIFNSRAKVESDSLIFKVTPDLPTLEYEELAEGLLYALVNQLDFKLDLKDTYSGAIYDIHHVFKRLAENWPAKRGDIWNVIHFTEESSAFGVGAVRLIIDENLNTTLTEAEKVELNEELGRDLGHSLVLS